MSHLRKLPESDETEIGSDAVTQNRSPPSYFEKYRRNVKMVDGHGGDPCIKRSSGIILVNLLI